MQQLVSSQGAPRIIGLQFSLLRYESRILKHFQVQVQFNVALRQNCGKLTHLVTLGSLHAAHAAEWGGGGEGS